MKTHSICILCEGYEEYEYLVKLLSLDIFNDIYLIDLINVKSINNLYPRYIEKYTQNSYHLVLIFCDTDKASLPAYQNLKKNINEFHNSFVSDKIIIFGKPCTMQIILSHFAEVKLKSQSKSMNKKIIKELANIEDYKATSEQRKELFKLIKRKNYEQMKCNLQNISTNDSDLPSTNFLYLINNLENSDCNWIKEINKIIDND